MFGSTNNKRLFGQTNTSSAFSQSNNVGFSGTANTSTPFGGQQQQQSIFGASNALNTLNTLGSSGGAHSGHSSSTPFGATQPSVSMFATNTANSIANTGFGTNPNANAFGTSSSLFGAQQQNTSLFDGSRFMSRMSSSILSQNSHFYNGKTVFGGSNNYNFNRASRLSGTTPYNLSSRHTLAPCMKIRANQSKALQSNDELSSTTKKIFEKLERASTPLQDVKRIPVYNLNSAANSSLGYQQLSRSAKRIKYGPPIASILTPNKAIIDTRNKPIKWDLSQFKINEDISKRNDMFSVGSDTKKSDSQSVEIIDNRVNLTDGGGKITNKNNKLIKNDATYERDNNVNLKSVGLPFPVGVPLPKFDFSYASKNQSKKNLQTTVVTRVEDNSKFKFSSPVLKKNEKNMEENVNCQSSDSQFTFSSPTNTQITDKRIDSLKTKQSVKTGLNGKYYNKSYLISQENENKTEKIKNCDNDMWTCRCLFRNKPEYKKCCSCNTERGATKAEAIAKPVLTTGSLVEMFKRPTGSWNCPSCLTNMSSDKTNCACCGEPKPGIVNTANSSENTALPDNWQCFHCKKSNIASAINCEACKQTKKVIATQADLDKLYSSPSFKFDASKFSNDIPDSKIKDKFISKQSNDKTQSFVGTTAGFHFSPSVTTSANITPISSVTTVYTESIVTATKDNFKFGLPKSFDSKLETSKESSNTSNMSISTSNANLFKFGSSSPISTISSFSNQQSTEELKPNELTDSRKEKLEVTNKKETTTQSAKPTEIKAPSFSFGSSNSEIGSTFDGTLFGSNNLKNITYDSNSTSNSEDKPKVDGQTKKVSPFISFPMSTASSTLFTTSLFNSGSNIDNSSKNLFTFGLANKPTQAQTPTTSSSITTSSFTAPVISNPLFSTASTTIATTSATKSTITTTTTTASLNKIVFGDLNKNSAELSSTNSSAVSKANFFFTPTLTNTNPNPNSNQETTFRSNNLFGSAPNKTFSFGNTPLNNSQTGFTFNANSTNASTVSATTASTISFGSPNANDNNNAKTTTTSLFTFGNNKTGENQSFGIPSIAPKTNTNTQFNFGAIQTTGQPNNTSIFTNPINPSNSSNPQNTTTINNTSIFSNPLDASNSQNNTSIFSNPSSATNPQNRMAFSANSAPNTANSGYNFSITNPMMPSLPSLPSMPLQQQIPQQPNFNFSQMPTFDFSRGISSAGNQSVFQFSAEQTNTTNQPASRNFKKAKRRLNNAN